VLLRTLAILTLLIITCFGLGASADEPAVAVLGSSDDAALANRISAEIEALGFAARIVHPDTVGSTSDLGRLAREAGADAAVRADEADGRIEVWATDPRTEQVVYRSIVVSGEGEDAIDEIALGAVELLRASLMEVRAAGAVEPAVEPSTSPDESVVTDDADSGTELTGLLTLELGPAVIAMTFDAPPSVNILVGVHVRAVGMLGVEALGITPMVRSVIDEDEGRAEIHFGLVGGGLRLSLGDRSSRWIPCGAVGFAAAFFQMTAQAEGPLAGREELVATPVPYGRLGLALELHERVHLRADVLVGWTLSKTVVRMAEREVAALGTPLLAGALGVEFVLF